MTDTTLPEIGRDWYISQVISNGIIAVLLDESTAFQDNFGMSDFIANEVGDSGYSRVNSVTLTKQSTSTTSGEEVTFYVTNQIEFINNGSSPFSFTHLTLITGGNTTKGNTDGVIIYLAELNGASGVTLNSGQPFRHIATIGFKNVIE
ncbi:UNVERIFIED_CONTAM: hypothetical protein BEN50_10790 [Euhalothece sp. KZN 001]